MKKFSSYLTLSLILIIGLSAFTNPQNWQNEISSHYFYIKVADSDKFWDLSGHHPNTAKNGLQFQIWSFDEDKYERSFTFPSIRGTDRFCIKNLAGYIVDISGKTKLSVKEALQKKMGKKFDMKKDKGAKVQTWTIGADGVPEWQQYRLIVVNRNTVMFENVYSGKAIDINGGGVHIQKNGTKLQMWDRNNSSAQQFQLVYADGPKKGQILDFEK